MVHSLPEGMLKRLYIDRDNVKANQHTAKPWVVETATGKWRGTAIYIPGYIMGNFDLGQKPCIWLETRAAVHLDGAEVG